jgi:HEAT repeat protein
MTALFKDMNRQIKTRASAVLAMIREPAILPLVEALKDENEDVRMRAREALKRLPPF